MVLVPWKGPPQAWTSCPFFSQRTAVIGRTEFHSRLASQAVMLASNRALLRAKNTLASSSRLWWSRRDTHWANRFQWPAGVSDPGGSSQYSAMTLWVSVSPAL
jgi:hypothetical protein